MLSIDLCTYKSHHILLVVDTAVVHTLLSSFNSLDFIAMSKSVSVPFLTYHIALCTDHIILVVDTAESE